MGFRPDPSPPSVPSGSPRWPWAGILALALLLRLVQQFTVARDPLLSVPVGDAEAYLAWARLLAAGSDVTGDLYYQAPLYPHLAALVLAAGGGTLALRILAAVGGALACLLVGRGTASLAGEAEGRAAALLLAVHPPALHYEALFEKTGLAVLLVSALVFTVARWRHRPGVLPALALGALLGLLSMSRENLLLLVPIGAWIVARGRGARHGAQALALLAAGLALVLAPLLVRNLQRAGRPGLVAANLGPNLYIGNHPGADGLYQPLVPGRGHPGAEREDAVRLARAQLGPGADAAAVSRWWSARVLAWWRAEPMAALGLQVRKLRLLLHPREWMDSTSYVVHRERSPLLRGLGSVLGLSPLLVLGLVGLCGPRRRELRPLALLLAGGALSVVLFFVFGRFRMTLLPLLVPAAGTGLVELLRDAHRRRLRSWFIAAAGAAAVALGALTLDPDRLERPRVDTFNNIGSALERAGSAQQALDCYRTALEADPEDPSVRFNLGRLLVQAGRIEEAAGQFARAVAREPAYLAEAHLIMARARAAAGDLEGALAILEEARRVAPAWLDLEVERGRVLRRAGRTEEARRCYEDVLARRPDHVDALNNLGYLLELEGDERGAHERFEAALAADPTATGPRVNLAWLLATSREPGVGDGTRALELVADLPGAGRDPELLELEAAARARTGRPDLARELCLRAAALAREEGRADLARRLEESARSHELGRPVRRPRP